jgi:hypothetical protein
MLAMSGEVPAQTPTSGSLAVRDATGSSSCLDGTVFFEGQSVRLGGSGFDSGATVTISFGEDFDTLTALSTTSADSSGAIDHVVAIPTGLATPVLGVMEAVGPTVAGAKTLYLTQLLPIADGPGSDTDLDGIPDICDNCSAAINPGQDDTDLDGCGNLCDSDYDQDGISGFTDFGQFGTAYGTDDEEKCHVEPIPDCVVGIEDYGFFSANFGKVPGPSGITAGTTACSR